MVAIIKRMPSGIPGSITRMSGAIVETAQVGSLPLSLGQPVQLDMSGKLIPATDATKPIYGFIVRQYPMQAHNTQEKDLGEVTFKSGDLVPVLRAGYISVKLSQAEGVNISKGSSVKIVFTDTGNFKAGDIAFSQGTSIERCFFMGDADSSGNTEISWNI